MPINISPGRAKSPWRSRSRCWEQQTKRPQFKTRGTKKNDVSSRKSPAYAMDRRGRKWRLVTSPGQSGRLVRQNLCRTKKKGTTCRAEKRITISGGHKNKDRNESEKQRKNAGRPHQRRKTICSKRAGLRSKPCPKVPSQGGRCARKYSQTT